MVYVVTPKNGKIVNRKEPLIIIPYSTRGYNITRNYLPPELLLNCAARLKYLKSSLRDGVRQVVTQNYRKAGRNRMTGARSRPRERGSRENTSVPLFAPFTAENPRRYLRVYVILARVYTHTHTYTNTYIYIHRLCRYIHAL